MLTYFELYQARLWAIHTLNSHANMKFILDVNDVDESSKWFLSEDSRQCNNSVYWYSFRNRNKIEFSNSNNPTTTLHIMSFTNDIFLSSLYISLYNMTTGTRFETSCLIIWDRAHPHLTNIGYADGRCPEYIDL